MSSRPDSATPPRKGSSSSLRRDSVLWGSNRAQRTDPAKSKSVISEPELKRRIDRSTRLSECLSEIVIEGDIGEGEFDQVGISLNPSLPLSLLDQRRADTAADPHALLA